MTKCTFLSFVVILLTFGSSIAQKAAGKKLAIVFVGNSITQRPGSKGGEAPPYYATAHLKTQKGIVDARFFNAGKSGATTVDFLPETGKQFAKVINGAEELSGTFPDYQLIFSIKLGTNDSAIQGPNGSPVSPDNYRKNMETIINELLNRYPTSKVIVHHGIWYSTNTYNGSKYLEEGLLRLQSYFPVIDKMIIDYQNKYPNRVFLGDKKAFRYFKKNHEKLFIPENGKQGTFYLHPNEAGGEVLGRYWAKAISRIL